MSQNLIVTIDGPAGAGKSAVSQSLAKKLNVAYLDTGAMYRAITLKALRLKIDFEDEHKLLEIASSSTVRFGKTNAEGQTVLLDDQDVTEDIRLPEVTKQAHYVARHAGIRAILVKWQQAIGQEASLVVEGRDAGTVIFPKASYKFYLNAELNKRCERRHAQLAAKGIHVDINELRRDMEQRDHHDSSREASPLKKADDAIEVDCTELDVDQTADELLKYIS